MQLSDIRKLTWPQMLFICAVLTLMISSALQYFTPRQAPLQETVRENFLGGTTEFAGVTYTGELFSPPIQLSTGRITAQQTEHKYFIQRIADLYDLEQDADIPVIWRNSALVFTGGDESFQLTMINGAEFSGVLTYADAAVAAAQEVVESIYEVNPPTANKDGLKYYVDGSNSHPVEVQPSQATIVEVPFLFSFEGYPLYVANTIFTPITVLITERDKLLKFSLTPQVVSVEKSDSYQTIPLSAALENIEQNNATIIASEYGGHGTPSMENITQAIFTTATIEYRADTASDTVVPYYHFIGQLTNTENETFTGHVITPAVQTDFSQK